MTEPNQPYALSKLPEPVQVNDVGPADFHQKILNHYQPVVIKGFAAQWPLVQHAKQSANEASRYLRDMAADKPVNLVTLPKSTNGRMFYSDDLMAMNFSAQQVRLPTSLDLMSNNASQDKLCVQCVSVKEHFPSLLSQLPNPLLPKVAPFIWLGNDITVAPHFDEANNIAVVAAGTRRFTLFPPEQIENLYIGPIDHTPAGQPISLVNLHAPDLEQHPKYKTAYQHGLSVELSAGDAIYIPSPWWHHVQSLCSFNILINYWWSHNSVSSQLPFPMLMHAMQSLQNMSDGERHAWQAILKHYLFDNEGASFDHIPHNARGILAGNSSQQVQMIQRWLAAQIR